MKRVERGLKRAAFRAARRWRPEPFDLEEVRERLAAHPPGRILVVRQDRRLGNLVLLTSLLAGLRAVFSGARIDVCAPHVFAAVLETHPAVDRLIQLDHRACLEAPWKIAVFRKQLRMPAVADLVIDASPAHEFSLLGGLICAGSGAPLRLGHARGEAASFLNVLAPVPDGQLHEHRQLHGLVQALVPAAPPALPPAIHLTGEERERARRARERWGWAARPVVGLHPGGRRAKRWPIERFERAARLLEAQGAGVLVFHGPAERPLLDAMRFPGPTRIVAPPTDVRGLASLLTTCDVLLSGDCGPMHLAAAVGVPCVAIFRMDDAWRYGPAGKGHVVLDDQDDRLEPESVAAAVGERLAQRATR